MMTQQGDGFRAVDERQQENTQYRISRPHALTYRVLRPRPRPDEEAARAESRIGNPEHFGLTRRELLTEVRRCQRDGWRPWELRTRFTDPASVPAEGWSS